jgi:hypothetical protein
MKLCGVEMVQDGGCVAVLVKLPTDWSDFKRAQRFQAAVYVTSKKNTKYVYTNVCTATRVFGLVSFLPFVLGMPPTRKRSKRARTFGHHMLTSSLTWFLCCQATS